MSSNINSLWPSDAIWRHKSGSALAHVMACGVTAPSLYLNKNPPQKPWTNVDLSSVMSSGIHLKVILQEILQPSFTKISLKITYLKFDWNPPGANELIQPFSPSYCFIRLHYPSFLSSQEWLTLEKCIPHLICRGLLRIKCVLELPAILRFLTLKGSINTGFVQKPQDFVLLPKKPELVRNIDSLWLSDAIWQHRSVLTMDQVMACCLAAPSHYLVLTYGQ